MRRNLRNNIIAALLCAAGVALNILLNTAITKLDLPLYLDTVGTVVAAISGGYLPGVVVGFTTNLIKAINAPESLYYGVLSVLIALFATFLSARGWHKKIRGMIGMVLVFSFLGGVVGALVPWFREDFSFESGSVGALLYESGFGTAGALFISKLLLDLTDKIVTMILAVTIVRLIPDRLRKHFRFRLFMQNPSAWEQGSRRKIADLRSISLRMKFLLVLIFSLTTVSLVCTVIGAGIFRKTIIEEHKQVAASVADLAAELIDGDRVNEYLETKGNSDSYRKTAELLQTVYDTSPKISYLYVYRILDDACQVVFDCDAPDLEADSIGDRVDFDPAFADVMPDLHAGREILPVVSVSKTYGYMLTYYKPVYDSAGQCMCYVGVDVDMNKVNAYGKTYLLETISIFMGFFLLLCVFTMWLVDYQLVLPINSIAKGLNQLAETSDTQEHMDEDVKMFRSLGIRTGDEIENLYLSAAGLIRNQAEQMRSIRRLSDSTAKMQDGLIITMADLVESRDSDTGAHVQKTAAYVKIIVEGLKKKGYYLEKLTPKFMSDVVRSAPLHDIGKINIPDVVLNKPGKLTDEEFEIMKTHTTAGKRIMENAISTVQGDNYLKEARNMAAYHHERWDGKGYPEGLHGEVIPLAARIMSVADVFDALTSPRVYKPAFSLEKSLEILEEGKGTQFDPKCVEVFMDALPEVQIILKKYNREK